MPVRRSHLKSRKGCSTCKQRHVKCDEGGPPCERCRARGTACDYEVSKASHSSQDNSTSASGFQEIIWTPDPPQKGDGAQFPADRRLLELQLMNHWSTTTYKSACTPGAEDDAVWQALVPELGLRYDFLMNGLLALSAFETARTSKRNYREYVNFAVECHALALGSFRHQLPRVIPENHEAVLIFSLMLMVLALASAQFVSEDVKRGGGGAGMVQNTIVHFELIRGCGVALEGREEYLDENPYLRRLKRFEDLPRMTLEDKAEGVLKKLTELNDGRIKKSMSESDEMRAGQIVCWEACKKALGELRECFERCTGPVTYQGYALAWLNLAGEEYVETIKMGDRTALLILMLWGLLVQRIGKVVWWAQEYGEMLVEEISTKTCRDEEPDSITRDVVITVRELVLGMPDGKV